jgi:hypothetical protein
MTEKSPETREPLRMPSNEAELLGMLEKARLEGVKLAAITAAHHINNDISLAVGVMDILDDQGLIPPNYSQMAKEGVVGLQTAGTKLTELGRIDKIVTEATPLGPIINIRESLPKPPTAPKS